VLLPTMVRAISAGRQRPSTFQREQLRAAVTSLTPGRQRPSQAEQVMAVGMQRPIPSDVECIPRGQQSAVVAATDDARQLQTPRDVSYIQTSPRGPVPVSNSSGRVSAHPPATRSRPPARPLSAPSTRGVQIKQRAVPVLPIAEQLGQELQALQRASLCGTENSRALQSNQRSIADPLTQEQLRALHANHRLGGPQSQEHIVSRLSSARYS